MEIFVTQLGTAKESFLLTLKKKGVKALAETLKDIAQWVII